LAVLDLLGMLLDRAETVVREDWGCIIVAILVAAAVRRNRGRLTLRAMLRALPHTVWLPAAVSLAISIIVFARAGVPLAPVEDEYSHLLVADTLRHGRVANPPHPMHEHFETMLVLQEPHYASQFPPGNGAALALFPLPIAGMWLVTALAVAAIAWAAGAVLPPGWSVLTGLLAALHPTVIDSAQLYNSSAVPLLGGALCAGALWRMRAAPSQKLGAIAALGAITLANSRPYEGLVLVVALAVTNLRAFRGKWTAGAIVLALGAIELAAFNHAVTGSVFLHPHALYDRTYKPVRTFAWDKPHAVTLPNEEMRVRYATVYGGQDRRYTFRRSLDEKSYRMTRFIAPELPGGLELLFAVPLVLIGRRRRTRPLLAALLLFLFAPLSLIWVIVPHYVAPAGVIVAVVFVSLMREAAAVRRHALVVALVAIAVFAGVLTAATYQHPRSTEVQRLAIERQLAQVPGGHLILVPPNINDCVYNSADIDGQRVVWARQLGGAKDAELLRYYSRRRVWLLGKRDGRLFVTPTGGSSVPPRPPPLP
jgi:hypothetical protein